MNYFLVRRGAALAVVLLLVTAVVIFLRATDDQEIKAQFTEVKGVYVGDDVTVLGVPVGKITEIDPGRDSVEVTMEIERGQKIPADAKAGIVSKSLVSVRSIVIGPAFSGGRTLADGATIPISRTTVPVEFDEVKDELVELTDALGPEGANKDGATSELISSSSSFLEGRGADINQTIKDLSTATETLADNKGDTFATVRNLQVFVAALRSSDASIRSFESNLAEASEVLDANSAQIDYGIRQFKTLLTEQGTFFRDQGGDLVKAADAVERITDVVSNNRQSVADLLQIAPTAVSNFYNILDPRDSAAAGEVALAYGGDPAYLLCGAVASLSPPGDASKNCRNALGPLVQVLKVTAPPIGAAPLENTGVGPDLVTTPEEANILGKGGSR